MCYRYTHCSFNRVHRASLAESRCCGSARPMAKLLTIIATMNALVAMAHVVGDDAKDMGMWRWCTCEHGHDVQGGWCWCTSTWSGEIRDVHDIQSHNHPQPTTHNYHSYYNGNMFTRSIFTAIEYMAIGMWMSIMAILSSLGIAVVDLFPSSWAMSLKRRYKRVIDNAPEDAMFMIGNSYMRRGHKVFYDHGGIYVLNLRGKDDTIEQIHDGDGVWTKVTHPCLSDSIEKRGRHITPTSDVVNAAADVKAEPLVVADDVSFDPTVTTEDKDNQSDTSSEASRSRSRSR